MFNRAILLCALISLPAFSQADVTFGHWSTGATNKNEQVYAATVNDSGALLGEYCSFERKTCNWILGVRDSCEADHSYPVLLSTEEGAEHFDIICVGKGTNGLYSFVISNWKDLEKAIKSGSRVGIAVPMQGDQFKVYRFLLDGITASTKSVEAQFLAAAGAAKPKIGQPTNSTVTDTL